jgi:hypothetical protein
VIDMLTRRAFCALPMALAIRRSRTPALDLRSSERVRVLRAATSYLREPPVTITSFQSPRSAGGSHDYFSEGDYWWPDPSNPGGPYIQRDGMTNPDNFIAHRHALMQLSLRVPALTAAWLLTKERRFADQAVRHLVAWFVDARTRMNPHLLYAQAIHGRATGRGTGIIDTIHLVEVVRAATALEESQGLTRPDADSLRDWVSRYLTWITTHEYGIAERDARNNHGTCWVMQAAEFARFAGRGDVSDFCRDRFKTVLVPQQIAADGSFPEELRRTKPYGYCLFNLDAMAMVCQILSTSADSLWTWQLPDGRGIKSAMNFMVPFIRDKRSWRHPPDVMYFDQWPVRQPALLFAGLALDRPDYLELWKSLDSDPAIEEVIRNYFIRQPVLWVG